MDYISGLVDPLQIFNGTHVINTWDTERWTLANTPTTNPPVFEWIAEVKVFSSGQRLVWASPDLAKMEKTVSLITANNGKWTADREGWVQCYASAEATAGTSPAAQIAFILNGEVVDLTRVGFSSASQSALANSAIALIRVKVGDEVRISCSGAIGATSVTCYYIPPLLTDTNLSWPEMPDGAAVPVMVPDFKRIQYTNLITANGGTWTADRVGFVKAWCGSGSNGERSIYLNNEVFGGSSIAGGANTIWLPVTPGDVVKITSAAASSAIGCYFIPPKYINKELPVVVEKNGSYSLEEVKTADTWIDGQPIYKKTIPFTNFAYGTAGGIYVLESGFGQTKQAVKMEGFSISNDNGQTAFINTSLSGWFIDVTVLNNDLIVRAATGSGTSNISGYITVYYTKNS
jgi:hypothetical protein